VRAQCVNIYTYARTHTPTRRSRIVESNDDNDDDKKDEDGSRKIGAGPKEPVFSFFSFLSRHQLNRGESIPSEEYLPSLPEPLCFVPLDACPLCPLRHRLLSLSLSLPPSLSTISDLLSRTPDSEMTQKIFIDNEMTLRSLPR